MATKGRESNAKEKRAAPPLSTRKPGIVQQRRSPNPPLTTDRKKTNPSTSTETKNVTNHLNLSRRSSLDPSSIQSITKKQTSLDKNKPPRRSFDKPPSPSQVPSNRLQSVSMNSNEKNLKGSSSISSKATLLSKTRDVGKPLLPRSSTNAKKDTMGISNKKQITKQPMTTTKGLRSSEKKKQISVIEYPKQQVSILEEDQKDDKKSVTSVVDNGDILILDEDDKQCVDDEDDLLNGEVKFENSDEIPLCEPRDDQEATIFPSVDQSQETAFIDDQSTNLDQDHDHMINDQEPNNHQDQKTKTHQDQEEISVEFEENEDKDSNFNGENQETKEENDVVGATDEKEEEIIPKEEEKIEEKDEEIVSKNEDDSKMSMVMKKQQAIMNHGKKETTAYNDVIEETANKLRTQRKNKVSALVGAFETVISLESD